jgi:signal transduction histidine kinase
VLRQAVEPFFSTKPSHLGVGLSIAKRHLAASTRGTLSIRSQPGEGTAVRLCVMPLRLTAVWRPPPRGPSGS